MRSALRGRASSCCLARRFPRKLSGSNRVSHEEYKRLCIIHPRPGPPVEVSSTPSRGWLKIACLLALPGASRAITILHDLGHGSAHKRVIRFWRR